MANKFHITVSIFAKFKTVSTFKRRAPNHIDSRLPRKSRLPRLYVRVRHEKSNDAREGRREGESASARCLAANPLIVWLIYRQNGPTVKAPIADSAED